MPGTKRQATITCFARRARPPARRTPGRRRRRRRRLVPPLTTAADHAPRYLPLAIPTSRRRSALPPADRLALIRCGIWWTPSASQADGLVRAGASTASFILLPQTPPQPFPCRLNSQGRKKKQKSRETPDLYLNMT